MSNTATIRKREQESVERPEKSERSAMKNLSWNELTRPIPCYLVMFISSVFQAILAVLLLPYNLLNRPEIR
jgi:hypothetical protein